MKGRIRALECRERRALDGHRGSRSTLHRRSEHRGSPRRPSWTRCRRRNRGVASVGRMADLSPAISMLAAHRSGTSLRALRDYGQGGGSWRRYASATTAHISPESSLTCNSSVFGCRILDHRSTPPRTARTSFPFAVRSRDANGLGNATKAARHKDEQNHTLAPWTSSAT